MAISPDPTPARSEGVRRALSTLGVVAVAGGAIFGADLFGVRDSVFGSATPAPRAAALSPFASVNANAQGPITVLRSQPWWQGVREVAGTGASSATFRVGSGASQWRAKWKCQRGRLVVRASGLSRSLVDAVCPGTGTAYATRTGKQAVQISASGPWTLRVDQQVDVPLDEPPLPAMTSRGTAIVLAGAVNGIDQKGTGHVAVYRLARDSYALRLTNFYVSPNVDLQIRLSLRSDPHSTRDYLSQRSVFVAPLDVTAGSLNFAVPRGVDPTRYRSVVVWCPLVTSAYAAAPLKSTG